MGFFDSLTGSSQRKDMRNGMEAFSRATRNAKAHTTNYAASAKNYLTPYQQRGDQAYGQYANALGVNGQDAQQGYWDMYQGDPQRAYDERRAVDAVNTGSAARGMSRSGLNALAGARASQEMGRSYTTGRLNCLRDLSGDGLRVAGQLSNIDLNTGQQLAGYEMMDGQSRQAMHQGLGSTRNMGFNNALALGGLAVGGFTPTAKGQSAFGNMYAGMNRLF